MIQVYSGNGKGKTTAAVGQAVRASAAGKKVIFIFFNKKKDREFGEDKVLERIGVKTVFFAENHPAFCPSSEKNAMRKETLSGLKFVEKIFIDKSYDMIILDEILISVREGFISEEELLSFIRKKPDSINVVLTGRGLTQKIQNAADTVSIIKCVKHHYDKGVQAKAGIEY